MDKILNDMDELHTKIRDTKKIIANLKADKIKLRAEAWKDAEGIADAKKDYVRSVVSDVQNEIDKLESDVEYYYNQAKLLTYKLEFWDE